MIKWEEIFFLVFIEMQMYGAKAGVEDPAFSHLGQMSNFVESAFYM